jgi:Threonine aldolase
MRARLSEDHANAALLAQGLEKAGVDVENVAHRTNMVFFRLPQGLDGEDFAARCAARGLLLKPVSPGRVRMVTHLDVDEADVRSAVAVVEEVLRR